MISKWFKRKEFECKCGKCGQDTVDAELLAILEDVREHFDRPVIINSANRCPTHNKRVGGASRSVHLTGKAADIVVKGVAPDIVHAYLTKKYPDSYGIGKYNTFTHVDSRTGKSRWIG
ncbi:D-Ala-D-Ala carboxypeptidase family metallohydrolase [Salmonella enterica]|uniref:D-Ala-D-Ala carboxypeptidase family metallohydrolase n=1 Tax=Salmonella enterica TaxID=28901 RepID=UPI000D565CD3|nr:D-Ala-D-Ala carboxypeptidase family metallohydrolase [Salmonella enterica]PVO50882.1 serine/threonine protein kinase [Salmonella enterica subsp. enterica serovar Newport]